jgi:hypothetical protein
MINVFVEKIKLCEELARDENKKATIKRYRPIMAFFKL